MLNKQIEHFQKDVVPNIDGNYIFFIKAIKFLSNIILNYILLSYIVTNFYNININQFILIACLISAISLYILDLAFPLCNLL
jgi:hypothetical protein